MSPGFILLSMAPMIPGAFSYRIMSRKHKYEAVLFDLDGTLVDSLSIWKDIDIAFLGKRGITSPEGLQKDLGGLSMYETGEYMKRRFSLSETVEEMMEEWNDMAYDAYRYSIGLKEGAEDFLCFLKDNAFPTGLATSNSRRLVEAAFEKNHLHNYIDIIISSDEVKRGKPAPDVYLECAKRLGVKPDKCLVFEDHPDGIQAAKNAGMMVVAVDDSFTAEEVPEKKRLSDLFISDYNGFDRGRLFG